MADYQNSLKVLAMAKEIDPNQYTKCGLMVGLGETKDEIIAVMKDLRSVACDFITIGQYLRPGPDNLEVVEFVTPEMFEEYKKIGEELGFTYVASSPFVRSSFHSEEALKHIRN
jgi:lipoic acid synthetase